MSLNVRHNFMKNIKINLTILNLKRIILLRKNCKHYTSQKVKRFQKNTKLSAINRSSLTPKQKKDETNGITVLALRFGSTQVMTVSRFILSYHKSDFFCF